MKVSTADGEVFGVCCGDVPAHVEYRWRFNTRREVSTYKTGQQAAVVGCVLASVVYRPDPTTSDITLIIKHTYAIVIMDTCHMTHARGTNNHA